METDKSLPQECYVLVQGKTWYVQRGSKPNPLNVSLSQTVIDDLNAAKGVSKEQADEVTKSLADERSKQ
jgi:hypothetical protein